VILRVLSRHQGAIATTSGIAAGASLDCSYAQRIWKEKRCVDLGCERVVACHIWPAYGALDPVPRCWDIERRLIREPQLFRAHARRSRSFARCSSMWQRAEVRISGSFVGLVKHGGDSRGRSNHDLFAWPPHEHRPKNRQKSRQGEASHHAGNICSPEDCSGVLAPSRGPSRVIRVQIAWRWYGDGLCIRPRDHGALDNVNAEPRHGSTLGWILTVIAVHRRSWHVPSGERCVRTTWRAFVWRADCRLLRAAAPNRLQRFRQRLDDRTGHLSASDTTARATATAAGCPTASTVRMLTIWLAVCALAMLAALGSAASDSPTLRHL
jgi:hypothetical protein